ncbi:MAG: hypothetical protein RIC35_24645 [Marinoscillum sp.]
MELKAFAVWVLVIISLGKVHAQNITQAEYYIDDDDGIGMNTSIPVSVSATAVTLDFNVPLTTVDDGIHTLFVRVKDSDGQWSLSAARPFLKLPDQVAGIEITKAEYFLDNDLGFGNNTQITITNGPNTTFDFDVPIDGLSNGIHMLYVRVMDTNGYWSLYDDALILKGNDPVSGNVISMAEYFIGEDPGFGQGTSFDLSSGSGEVSALFTLDLSDISRGFHRLSVRVMDDQRNWSLIAERLVNVIDDEVSMLDRLEYYYVGPNDFTSSTYIVQINPQASSVDADFTLDATELTIGETYSLYMRATSTAGDKGAFTSVEFVFDGSILWVGGSAGSESDWGIALNWDTGTLPSETDDVIIPPTLYDPIIEDYFAVDDLTIEENVTLALISGASLAIYGEVVNEGTYTVTRNTTGKAGYSIVSAPVSNAALANLNANHLYTFDGQDYIVPTGMMTPGQGYFLGYKSANPSVLFTGSPNFGEINRTVTSGNYELIGNPYCAPISIEDFLTENSTNIAGAVYFWDDGGSNVGDRRGGDYIAVNAVGVVGIQQPNETDDGVGGLQGKSAAENGVIPSTQGFFVESIADGEVTFLPAHQRIDEDINSDVNFYRINDFEKMRISLSGNELYNEILFGFRQDASVGRESHLDARKLSGNSSLSFYSYIGEELFSIQGRPLPNGHNVIQLGADITIPGKYRIGIEENSLNQQWQVEILDHVTNIRHDVKHDAFNFTVDSTWAGHRFDLILTRIEPLGDNQSRALTVYGSQQQLVIEASLSKADLLLTDVNGRVIITRRDVLFRQNRFNLDVQLRLNTVYLLHINGETVKFLLR